MHIYIYIFRYIYLTYIYTYIYIMLTFISVLFELLYFRITLSYHIFSFIYIIVSNQSTILKQFSHVNITVHYLRSMWGAGKQCTVIVVFLTNLSRWIFDCQDWYPREQIHESRGSHVIAASFPTWHFARFSTMHGSHCQYGNSVYGAVLDLKSSMKCL